MEKREGKQNKPVFPWWEKRQKVIDKKHRSSESQYFALGNSEGKSKAGSSPGKRKEPFHKKTVFPWWEKRQKAMDKKHRFSDSQYFALGNSEGKSKAGSSPVKWKEPVHNGEGAIELSAQQEYVLDLIRQGKNVFYTGNAGTGKTTLLREIQKCAPEGTHVTALTGVAAVQAGGVTLHSFAGIGLGNGTKEDLLGIVLRGQKAKNWRNTNVLIVDEVSMLDGRLFDKLEYIACKIRHCEKPFGGIQLVLCGDFFQLPPIPKVGETSVNYCFQSSAWTKVIDYSLELTQIYRQSDPKLIKLLNEVRYQCVSPESLGLLKFLKRPLSGSDIEPTKLYSHNRSVNDINNRKIESLPGEEKIYYASDHGQSPYKENLSKYVIAMEKLVLKKGAQVMLLKNLTEELINGSRGVVEDFDEEGWPKVKFADGKLKTITVVDWDLENSSAVVLAQRTQVPLKLAWAMTIHKSQGMSIDLLQVDLKQVFSQGQAYVALSRARTIEGLQVLTFDETKFTTSDAVIKFYKENIKKAPEPLGAELLQDVSPSCPTPQLSHGNIMTTPSKKRMAEEKAGNSAKKRFPSSSCSTAELHNSNAKHKTPSKKENSNSHGENNPRVGSPSRTPCDRKGFRKASELEPDSPAPIKEFEVTQPILIEEATDEECLLASPTPNCQLVVKRKRPKQTSLFNNFLQDSSNTESLANGRQDGLSRSTYSGGMQDGSSWNTGSGGSQKASTCSTYLGSRQNGSSRNVKSTGGIEANQGDVHPNTESGSRYQGRRATGSLYFSTTGCVENDEGNSRLEAKVKRQREKSKRKCSVLFDALKSDESQSLEEVENGSSIKKPSTSENNKRTSKRLRKRTKRNTNRQIIGDESPSKEVKITIAVSIDDASTPRSLKDEQPLSSDIGVTCERSRERSKLNCSKLFDALKGEDTRLCHSESRSSKKPRKDSLSPLNNADNNNLVDFSSAHRKHALTQTESISSRSISDSVGVANEASTQTDPLSEHLCRNCLGVGDDPPSKKTDSISRHHSSDSPGLCALTESSYLSIRNTSDLSGIILEFKIPIVSYVLAELKRRIKIMFYLAIVVTSLYVQIFYMQFQD